MRHHHLILSLLLLTMLLASACQPILLTEIDLPEQLPTPLSIVPVAEENESEAPAAELMPPLTELLAEFTEIPWPGGVPILGGHITSEALADNLLRDPTTRGLYVQLPPGYEESVQRYPVVYVLHWYTGDEFTLVSDVSRVMKKLLDADEVGEMILVYPNANNVFGGSLYMSSPTIGDYETYLTQELVQFIDANFRTIPRRDSRGITGCSMGGDGALHLAMAYPDVYSVAAPVSTLPDLARDPAWQEVLEQFAGPPEDLVAASRLPWTERWFLAAAAVAAPNPDSPPLHLDMPFEIVDGEARIVSEVYDQINALDLVDDTYAYLEQPLRLRAILLYHGEYDQIGPVEVVRDFDSLLTDLDIDHEYLEMPYKGHCDLDYGPVLRFMSDNLEFETP